MKAGDKVVCVNNGPCIVCGTISKLILGSVYVISRTSIGNSATKYAVRLDLLGMSLPNCHPSNTDVWFASRRFRLLDEMKKESEQRNTKHTTV
jgi:hypothetical protein